MKIENYLKSSEVIDYFHPAVKILAKELAKGCSKEEEIAEKCFLFVRDEIRHTGDHRDQVTTCKASDVLAFKTGWCYAKSHLLAALLRANGIPTGFCYQRLSCSEYKDDIFCLHGLNAVYLKKYGWYKIDARGNKEGVFAQFAPPFKKLAFELGEGEFDLASIYEESLDVVIEGLHTHENYDEMVNHFPDVKEFICSLHLQDAKRLSEISGSLLNDVFQTTTPQWFLDSFTTHEFQERLVNPEYQHFGYVKDSQIVGFISIKDDNHLYSLFVDEAYQKQGIATKLWEFVKENIEFKNMSTNASINAISVYESFGFYKVDGIKSYMELEYQPMVYER